MLIRTDDDEQRAQANFNLGPSSGDARPEADNLSYFDKKWTYAEFLAELEEPIEHPDPTDPDDPRYYRKYAHTVPPLDAYYFIPDWKDCVATNTATKNSR